jgi:hypothetical protein
MPCQQIDHVLTDGIKLCAVEFAFAVVVALWPDTVDDTAESAGLLRYVASMVASSELTVVD